MGLQSDYKAFNNALCSLYGHDLLTLAKDETPFAFDDTRMENAAKLVYENGGFDLTQLTAPEAQAIIEETARVLETAIASSLPHEVPDTIRYALENNAFVFSGFKTFHTLREVGLSMLTDKGDIKPFNDFLADVRRINEQYNHNYLYAEYNHAVGAAQMAAKWHDFEQDGDRYNLQYRTAGDDKVREEHAALNGTTLPPSDPFWSMFLPPNGWNCRCTAVQVRKNKYPLSDPEEAMKRGNECTEGVKRAIFRYNAGKSLQLFPPKHPYYKVPKEAKQAIEQVTQEAIKAKRIKTLQEQLPEYLSEKERQAIAANNYELEQALGIVIGKPMSVEEADKQSANPKHALKFLPDPEGNYQDKTGVRYKLNPDFRASDRQYSINCATCAPAYALRLMGFDIKAKGRVVGSGSLNDSVAYGRSFEMWKNTDGSAAQPTLTYDWMVAKGYKTMTPKRYKEFFRESCKEVGVYILTIGWKGGGGHATVLQRFADGSLKYIEPQEYDSIQGAKRDLDGLCLNGATRPHPSRGLLRVDDKIFDAAFLSLFDK